MKHYEPSPRLKAMLAAVRQRGPTKEHKPRLAAPPLPTFTMRSGIEQLSPAERKALPF